jgi:hypothetical protein
VSFSLLRQLSRSRQRLGVDLVNGKNRFLQLVIKRTSSLRRHVDNIWNSIKDAYRSHFDQRLTREMIKEGICGTFTTLLYSSAVFSDVQIPRRLPQLSRSFSPIRTIVRSDHIFRRYSHNDVRCPSPSHTPCFSQTLGSDCA